MTIKSINPSNYEVIGEVEASSLDEIKQVVAKAQGSKKAWKDTSLNNRIELIREIVEELSKKKQALGEIQAQEMGMPLDDALQDVDDSIRYIHWYLDHAHESLDPEITYETDTEIHQVYREPYGVVAVILPWNFPLANVVWGSIQALIAGNVIVMKHSEECLLSAQMITDIFRSKRLPEGVFSSVYGAGDVGELLVNQDIDMIQFTGSTKTGTFLYELAGRKFIKANMELGGSAPGILFEDADLEKAIPNFCDQRLFNSGQCCDGLKRLLVHKSLVDTVTKKLEKLFEEKVVGDAIDPKTEIGPLVSKKQLGLLEEQVADATKKGAVVVCGGKSLEKELGGAYFQPTILTGISPEMRVWKEEVFGPVLPIVSFSSDEEAIRLANDTTYGLGAYMFTADSARADSIATLLETGMVAINGVSYIVPSSPFGGYKNSGIGREHGKYGFHEVTQVKVVARPK